MCGKICKSKGGLTRHINAKHEKNVNDTDQIDENNFTVDDYCKLVNESAKSLSEDECYPESIRKQFETYAFSVSGNLAVKEQFSKINILYTSLRKGKVESFTPSILHLFHRKPSNISQDFQLNCLCFLPQE